MKETRYFKQFFEEEPSYLRPEDNLYFIDLTFDFESLTGEIIIPNPGGQMDMVPMSYQQEKWVKNVLENLNHKQIWGTMWTLLDKSGYDAIVDELITTKTPLICYSIIAPANETKQVLGYFEKHQLQPKLCRFSLPEKPVTTIKLTDTLFEKIKQMTNWESLKTPATPNLIQADTEIVWEMIDWTS